MVLSSFLAALAPGMLIFALGAFWQSWRASSSEVASQLNDLIKEIKDLEVHATEYWSAKENTDELRISEVKIRGITFVIAAFEEQSDFLFRNHKSRYTGCIDKLFIASTGGEFETKKRKQDFVRAMDVKQISAEAMSICRRARQDSAGMTAVYWLLKQKALAVWLFISTPGRWLHDKRMKPFFGAEND